MAHGGAAGWVLGFTTAVEKRTVAQIASDHEPMR